MALSTDFELSTPTLIRAARGAYAQAMRAALAEVGVEDLPRNGAFIMAGIDSSGGPRTDLPAELGVTKQAVSNAIEALVQKGFVERTGDPDDRGRIGLEFTDLGQVVGEAVMRAIAAVDLELTQRVDPGNLEAMRAALLALSEIKSERGEASAGPGRPLRQIRRGFPMFSVSDLRAATAHYRTLGFTVVADAEGKVHAFARREGAGFHLVVDDQPTRRCGVAYLHVRDADDLYAEWQAAGAGGELHPVESTSYGMREGAHRDLDGNIIHFGSDAADGSTVS